MDFANQLATEFLAVSIQAFHSMKKLADKAMAQVEDNQFSATLDPESNSLEILIQHFYGNMVSRWTDFLTSDGEKPDRNRDGEFEINHLNKKELFKLWEKGWTLLFNTLDTLKAEDLLKIVTIRGESLSVVQAIQRQISHYGYHVGQIVFLAKHFKSEQWQTLSVPRGQSKAYMPEDSR